MTTEHPCAYPGCVALARAGRIHCAVHCSTEGKRCKTCMGNGYLLTDKVGVRKHCGDCNGVGLVDARKGRGKATVPEGRRG